MKRTRIIILSILLGILGCFVAWGVRPFLLQNHVIFLLNQKDMPATRDNLNALKAKYPDRGKTRFLVTKFNVITRDYAKAISSARNQPWLSDYPEAYYWLAIASYQSGHDVDSRIFASKFLASNKHLSNATSMVVANGLAGSSVDVLPVDTSFQAFRMLFPVEQSVYLTLAAQSLYSRKDYDEATETFRTAFALGLRNDSALEQAVRAAAMCGKVQSADMFLAYGSTNLPDILYKEFLESYQKYQSSTASINPYTSTNKGGKLELAQALAWAGTAYLKKNKIERQFEVLRTLTDLQQEYPYDAIIKMRMAETLEVLDRNQEAYAIYKSLNDERLTMITSLRMWAMERMPEDKIAIRIASIIKNLDPIAVVSADKFSALRLDPGQNYITCCSEEIITAPLNIARTGNFLVTIICRGYQFSGKWPLISLAIDNKPPECYYINRPNWDCYSFAVPLDMGSHQLKLSYTNPGDKTTTATNVPNLEISSIIVTDPGVN